MATFFTSDTHFSHANIIGFCKRPFPDTKTMDDTMVERWNSVVGPDDVVWHLGDFAFGPFENVAHFLGRLNGRIHLVVGNHDRSLKRMAQSGFASVQKEAVISLGGCQIYLTHKPAEPKIWPAGTDYHFHGHVHERYARRGDAINVGVDVHDFTPVSFLGLLETPRDFGDVEQYLEFPKSK